MWSHPSLILREIKKKNEYEGTPVASTHLLVHFHLDDCPSSSSLAVTRDDRWHPLSSALYLLASWTMRSQYVVSERDTLGTQLARASVSKVISDCEGREEFRVQIYRQEVSILKLKGGDATELDFSEVLPERMAARLISELGVIKNIEFRFGQDGMSPSFMTQPQHEDVTRHQGAMTPG